MQWSAGPGAGFTVPAATPWLPIGDADRCNVEAQLDDPASTLSFCRGVIALRRGSSDLREGDLKMIDATTSVLAWRRGERTAIAINLSDQRVTLPAVDGTIALSTDRARDGERVEGRLALDPWEGIVVEGSLEP